MADRSQRLIVHLVGSVPLPDSETVFKTVAAGVGPHLARLPDGETGIRKAWIRFLQDILAENPAIEVATDVPPFKFTQWDGKVVREIPRLRVTNRIAAGVNRPIQFFHLPVPKGRTDDAFFAPMHRMELPAETELYLGLIHHDDTAGDDARLAAARKYVRVDGVATVCGRGRGDPARVDALLESHARVATASA